MFTTTTGNSPSAGTGRHDAPQGWIEFDPATFDPWRIQPVTHTLSAHPLLQLEALVELGERLEARGSIRTHGNSASAGTPFGEAPRMHPNPRSASATLRSIACANAWLSLLNVQTDPVYRELVRDVLGAIQPHIETKDPGMSYRAGWIFVSSPNTVTPFHFDKEHNFILQARGHKRVYVWDHRDTVVASEMARDRFHYTHGRELLEWREEFRERAQVFDLGPGQGAYMPSTSPHMVENGEEPSITVSFTYYTAATRRAALLHKTHELLRMKGMSLPPVGRLSGVDSLLFVGASAARRVRHMYRESEARSGSPEERAFAEMPFSK